LRLLQEFLLRSTTIGREQVLDRDCSLQDAVVGAVTFAHPA
jgi:hypothetical protein